MMRPGAEGLCLFMANNSGFDAYVAMKKHPIFGQYLWASKGFFFQLLFSIFIKTPF